jgi:DNA-binding CsgD family transcriptional regulator
MPNLSEKRIFQLIGSLYEVAQRSSAEAWTEVYDEMASILSCGPGSMTICFPEAGTFDLVSHNLDAAGLREYNEYYAGISPFRPILMNMRHGDLFVRSDVMPDEEYVKTELYQDFMRRYDIFNYRYEVLFESGGGQFGMTFSRPRSSPYFSDELVRVIDVIAPHLRRAFKVYAELISVGRENRAMAEAFDRIPRCVFIVDKNYKLVFANQSAHDLASEADGIELARNGVIRSSVGGRHLRSLLDEVFAPAGDAGTGSVRLFPRPSGRRPLEVVASPFTGDNGFISGQPLALLFVTDPEQSTRSAEAILMELHGLTASEAHIASLLAEGHSLAEICSELDIKQNTVKTHLKNIFAKTGTNRQSELVKLILSGSSSLKGMS